MLHVQYHTERDEEHGRFYVNLIDICHEDNSRTNRLGYWCDRGHLETFIRAINHAFTKEDADQGCPTCGHKD